MNTNTAAAIVVPVDAVEAVTGSLATNSVGQASIDFYRAALESAGVDPESLSFAEIVEVTRRLYAPSADYRRGQADVRKAERAAEAAKAKAKRDAEKKARFIAKREALEKALAAIEAESE